MEQSKATYYLSWVLRGTAAIILLQTLFYKFTGARESVYIFSTLHAEPWGRIGSGLIELVAGILLLLPRYAVFGSALSVMVAGGAMLSHILFLGVSLPAVDDHGELFGLAVIVFVCSAAALYLHRREIFAALALVRA